MDQMPTPGAASAVYLKDEGRKRAGWGHNASGSFKDRGMAMVVAMARHFRLRQLMVPTQGNAGDSLATFGPALGISVAVSMPRDTPAPILDRVARLAEEDNRVRLFLSDGTIREAGALLKEKMSGENAFSAATFAEPGWRIEGKKTLGLEIAEQLGWELPEVVVYPTGGGTGILGMWKAFNELRQLGLVRGNLPRMISVQSEGTTPLVKAMESGAVDCDVAPAGSTLAVGLNVPYGIGHFRVLEILRESGGAALAIDENAIVSLSRELESQGIGPEGAACLAALPELERRGLIVEGDRVVVVNTCSPEKYA
jgi:threonine synthase